jgi:hypothetical protein
LLFFPLEDSNQFYVILNQVNLLTIKEIYEACNLLSSGFCTLFYRSTSVVREVPMLAK